MSGGLYPTVNKQSASRPYLQGLDSLEHWVRFLEAGLFFFQKIAGYAACVSQQGISGYSFR